MRERIQQVLEIEKKAHAITEDAAREAELLPIQAEQEAIALLERSRAEAQEEARRMIAEANTEKDTLRILDQAKEGARRTDALAMSNFDRAVAYVISRVVGRE
jgi:vacuolar-type H+-ATPase subunit H